MTTFELVFGFQPTPARDLGLLFQGLKGCIWWRAVDVILSGGVTDASGAGGITLPLPHGTAGASFDNQVIGISPTGMTTSNPLTTRFENQ